jgi:similar to stage IV sporulation protein
MLGRWLWDFIKGYIIVQIYGNRIPEIINQATRENILLWEIRYHKDGSVMFKMRRQDFWQLLPHIRRTRTKVRFGRRIGLPFYIKRATHRKTFLIGAGLFAVSLYFLTSIVWNVEIEGTDKLSPETIRAAAKQAGIYRGQWLGRLPDTDILQAELLDKVPELSWVGVSIHGTKVHIQVVEKVPGIKPESNNPQNIVATKKGTIRDIFVSKGKATVTRGQLVNPGDMLISGSLGGGTVHVAAKGKVEADVWYTSEVTIPLSTKRMVYTGEHVNKDYLVLGSFPIQIWGYGKPPYPAYNASEDDRTFTIGSFTFPIKWRKVDIKEVHEELVTLTREEARQKALETARADVGTKMGKDGRVIAQKILQEKLEHGKLYVKVWTDVVEDIGKPQTYQQTPAEQSQDQT